jgi:hypothetical protein
MLWFFRQPRTGTNFLPSSIDTTVAGGKTPLPANFLRPIPGYQTITYEAFAGIDNYNALQVQLTKRFSRSFTYHMAWSWSKALDLVYTNGGNLNPVLNYPSRNYGLAGFDNRQSFVLNYVYSLPSFSKRWNYAFSRTALDGWEISGITSFIKGAAEAITYEGSGANSRSSSIQSVLHVRLRRIYVRQPEQLARSPVLSPWIRPACPFCTAPS